MKVSYENTNNITCNKCQRRIWDGLNGLLAKKNRPRGQDGFFLSTLAVGAGIHTLKGQD